ncbi:uncharacterized protein LOC135950416 [Calliphora vicina]|uniref:uncharacterized protein LOC135950416 n=1 Tax=Calliphora vicina TaxID=7373 RepID=UPI00325A9384
MNWFLLLLILKLLNINWAAPIDLLEANDDLQQDKEILDNLINKGFSVADEANNLFKTTEDIINSTENAYNFTALSESLKENVQQISQDLHNFTVGFEREVEVNHEKPTTEQTVEITTINQENGDQVAAIINSDMPVAQEETKQEEIATSSQRLVENTTEHLEKLMQDLNNVPVAQEETKEEEVTMTSQNQEESSTEHVEQVLLDLTNSSSDNVQPTVAESRSNPENILSISTTENESAVTENISNMKSSTESDTFTDHIVTPADEETMKELVEITENKTVEVSENKPEQNFDFTTTSSAANTEQVSQYSENISEQTTQDSKPETSTSNTQSIVENISEQTTQDSKPVTAISNTQSIVENLYENVENLYNQSEKLINNVLDKATETTAQEELATNTASNQDSTTFNNLEESLAPVTQENIIEEMSSVAIDNVTEHTPENFDLVLNSNNHDVAKETTIVEETTVFNPEETSNETSALKQTVDEFINQVADIGSSIGKAAEELRIDASMMHAAAENFSNPDMPIINQENMNETEVPTVAVEDNSDKAPSFKQAVDSFIEDVVEIGSKLGLIPEETPNEQITTTPESLGENVSTETSTAAEEKEDSKLQEVESSTLISNFEQSLDSLVGKLDEVAGNLDSNKTDLSMAQTEDKVEEIVTTTPSSMENLNEKQETNTEAVQNTENSNFGHSVETLIGAASEFGSNFGKAITGLFTVSENKPESATESPNDMIKETTTQEEQNKLENSEISSTHSPLEISQEDSTNFWMVDHENNEVSSTTSTPNESFQYSTEGMMKILEENHEDKHIVQQEGEDLTSQVQQENLENLKPKEEVHLGEYAEYIPVAVITSPEGDNETSKPIQQAEISQQLETIILNKETKVTEPEVQATQGEEIVIKNEELATRNVANENETSSTTESLNDNITAAKDSEAYTTLPAILEETSTTTAPATIEETTNPLTKFENTIKTLIEQEKLKHEEQHSNTLETTQQETTTLAPSTLTSSTLQEEFTTTTALEETTMPKKFEEELQMAVKALEETTHHHFEEFQNNLKQAFKKFTVWGAEHERSEETTTMFKNNLNEAVTTQQPLAEQPTTMMPEQETSQDSINVVMEDSYKTEEPHRSGVINQNFVDKFADNYQETSEVATTEMSMKKESFTKSEETTETPIAMTTMLPAVEEEQFELKKNENFVEATTRHNDVKEDLLATAENFVVNESTSETQEATTEYTTESSITPLLNRVPLEKDINSISLTLDNESNTVAAAQESTTQQLESESLKEKHLESTQTIQTTESMEEINTLPTPESSQQEMVTFIEHSETNTATQQQQQQQQEPKEDEDSSATSQTQEPLTQASFMEEQQQQIDSTTEHDAQTQTAATSGQTATTTTIDEDTLEQQTTETEIQYSTTVVEEDEMTMTTTSVEPPTTTIPLTPAEPEARSLSLPPPKLEYLQNEDGVEVFYGYSIVKHN